MRDIDKLLMDKKEDLDNIVVPKELEERLSNALKDKEFPKKRFIKANRIIVACILMFLITFNFNTLAYYSKKLIGYDQLMNTTLKNLNDLGMGQIIGESHTFSNGVLFTLDGIMIDDNQLLAFYTVTDNTGENDFISLDPSLNLKGLYKRYFMRSGHGEILGESNQTKWVMSFDPPAFYERTLYLNVYMNIDGMMEEGEIPFKLDRNKAMKSTLKQVINKTFKNDGVNLKLSSIHASPTSTVIEGSIQNILQLAIDKISGERIRPNKLEMKLIANGEEVEKRGGSMSTDINGIRFTKEFDALPSNLESVQIHLESLSIDKDVNKFIELNKDDREINIEIEGQNILIDEIKEINGSTYITFSTVEDVVLTGVYLIIDGEKINLKETLNSEYDKLYDGRVMHRRTMHFNSSGLNYQLSIERMSFSEKYNEVIDVK
ncbi:DUF4179 domain-containing protein [Serpentinicella alkaliphila]|uniref:Uncharacterized protein DUF4179 n=1 Tax=Serpentinicella alkaliphila TaxID=1734049 RepID=A0A4R2TZ84_9FIRM|nr:DUF4179 domain-containing protein [Serpentinicella alkaliphila]QUH24694.1 DUF4179 domain-containing protein [Serpentinicella alkaliphila]TCQ03039.1 uncharacterized protein DUF4179 [Serpentinicella alkaliphila]